MMPSYRDVFFFTDGPGLEEGLEAEGVMDAVQAGIREAQSGELLAHGM